MNRKISIILILILLSTNIFAQFFRIRFEHLSVTEGLSQSSVKSITQDSHGFMWFATLDGLNKFDGYEIYTYYSSLRPGGLPDNVINCVYTTPDKQQLWIGTADHGICKYVHIFDSFINYSHEKNPQTLINDHITTIIGDKENLWIGTEEGLSKFSQNDSVWISYTVENSPLTSDYITCLLIDKKENLWIGTKDGLFVFDIVTKKFEQINQNNGLPCNNINALSIDIYGNIWIGTANGIIYYNSQSGNFQEVDVLKDLPDQNITSLRSDFENILWIGTNNEGLVRYDPSSSSFMVLVHNPTDLNSLTVNSILDIYIDKTNILWIGTSLGGVDKWNRAAQELLVFRHNPYNSNSLSSSRVRSIFEDKDGIIWIGTVDGGLNKWDKDLQKFIDIKHNPNDKNSIPGNHIRSILEDSKGRFWIGTGNNGACIINQKTLKVSKIYTYNEEDSTSLSNNSIWKIIEDKSNNIWFATYGGGLCKLIEDTDKTYFKRFQNNIDDPTSLSNNYCTTILCDSKGRVWAGTNNGLNIFNAKEENFTNFKNILDDSTSLSNNRIYSIIEANDGTIWIGTKGGLNKYNEDGTFSSYTKESHDLSNNVIMGILEDNNKNLWLTTNQGLCKFDPTTFKSRTYDVKDGIQSNEFLVGSFLKTKDNMFIVGGINGFNAFYPEKIKDNENIPSIVITELMLSNQNIKLDTAISEKKYIELTNKQNDLTFRFVAIDYILPEKNQYAYRLIGYDKDWIYCKYEKSAKYTNLPPGHYTFQVKGSNNDLKWNEEGAKIKIYIKPAFYQTLAFKIGIILFSVFIIVFIAWLRIRIEKQQKEHLQREVDRQTKEIRQQRDEILEKNDVLTQQKEEILQQNEVLEQQKEEIEAQRDEIEDQRLIAVKQRDEIGLHKKEIEDSIIYAKRIQTAALPENKILQMLFSEYFILFRPRDIVSGDFYWATQKNGKLIAVAADCTGHGVPGAFMSMLGISFLHKIVNEKDITDADVILNRLRNNVVSSLRQTKDGDSKDGMDITICVIDYNTNTFDFAAANNPLYLIRDEELIEYKAEKMPIAIFEDMKPFSKQTIEFKKEDIIYMFSDGYADQFGGPKSKKFRYSSLQKVLLKIHKESMPAQKDYLENTLDRWMSYPDPYTGEDFQSQIDDIIIFGIRL
ncbi:MAG: SpoIIE family protein phosphatase [Bacteroidales bacterium]|nr:SpoIIE family protein phosphatase [Bacteroidales bacterium]